MVEVFWLSLGPLSRLMLCVGLFVKDVENSPEDLTGIVDTTPLFVPNGVRKLFLPLTIVMKY
jgi:hypothetical protein